MRDGILMTALAMALAGGAVLAQEPAQAPAQPAPKARAPKSPEEAKALQALFQSTSPDAQIAAADDFQAKFPSSDFKALVYLAEAQGYQQKNDYDHLVVYGEQALEADPDPGTKVQTLLLLSRAIAMKTGEYDLDREEKLSKVEKYATTAEDMLKTMPKPNPQLPDAQWDAAKADMLAEVHVARGQDQMVRKNYDKAAAEFKTAVEAAKNVDPSNEVRLAQAYVKLAKYDDAVAACDRVLATPNVHPMVKQAAESEKAQALKLKSAPPAAKP